jgi:hypothetical protein
MTAVQVNVTGPAHFFTTRCFQSVTFYAGQVLRENSTLNKLMNGLFRPAGVLDAEGELGLSLPPAQGRLRRRYEAPSESALGSRLGLRQLRLLIGESLHNVLLSHNFHLTSNLTSEFQIHTLQLHPQDSRWSSPLSFCSHCCSRWLQVCQRLTSALKVQAHHRTGSSHAFAEQLWPAWVVLVPADLKTNASCAGKLRAQKKQIATFKEALARTATPGQAAIGAD